MTEPNFHEIDLTIKDIEANEELHDQAQWAYRKINVGGEVCGTAMCAAGFTVARHGWKFHFFWPTDRITDVCRSPEGDVCTIAKVARDILGLSDRDATCFFAPENTLDDLKRMRDELNEHGMIPW